MAETHKNSFRNPANSQLALVMLPPACSTGRRLNNKLPPQDRDRRARWWRHTAFTPSKCQTCSPTLTATCAATTHSGITAFFNFDSSQRAISMNLLLDSQSTTTLDPRLLPFQACHNCHHSAALCVLGGHNLRPNTTGTLFLRNGVAELKWYN
jgi:hypothetical protein